MWNESRPAAQYVITHRAHRPYHFSTAGALKMSANPSAKNMLFQERLLLNLVGTVTLQLREVVTAKVANQSG